MKSIVEIAKAFYGVVIPESKERSFVKLVSDYLDERFSIETAIGMALRKLGII